MSYNINKIENPKMIKWTKILVFIMILGFFTSLITNKMVLPSSEDLPRQIMNGKDILFGNFDVIYKNVYSYTESSHPFANHHWFYSVFVYEVYNFVGFNGLMIFKVLLLLFSFSLLFYLATKRANFWLVALFSIPTILMLSVRSSLRPEIVSYFFIVLYLYLFYLFKNNPKSKKIFWIIPIQLIWANMHILFPVGVALVGAFWAEEIYKNFKNVFKNHIVRKLTLLLALTILVSFANPLGINGVIYSMKANTINTSVSVFSSEMQSISETFRYDPKSDHLDSVAFLLMLIPLLISFIVNYKKRPIFYILMSIAFLILSIKIIRGVPLFALIFLPVITENLNEIYEKLKKNLKINWSQIYSLIKWLVPIFFILFLFWVTFIWSGQRDPSNMFGFGITPTSNEPAIFFKENKLKGPIFNDTNIGSYLIYNLYGEEKVYVDNRFADAYSVDFLDKEYANAFVDENVWKSILEKYKFNSIVLNHYDKVEGMPGFIYQRMHDKDWIWVYAGREVVIFVKNNPENKNIIEKYAINQNNIYEKLLSLSSASDYRGQVGAGDLYGYFGNTLMANFIYEKIVTKWDSGVIWYTMGRNELFRNDEENSSDPARALIDLQHAIKLGYKTPMSYSYLALAYYRLGDIEKAKEAVKKELRLDRDNKDGQAWLDIFKNIDDKLNQPLSK